MDHEHKKNHYMEQIEKFKKLVAYAEVFNSDQENMSNIDEMCMEELKGKSITAAQEAIDYNIIKEYNGMKKIINDDEQDTTPENKYAHAKFKILEYIVICVREDPDNGDIDSEENVNRMKQAGRLLYEYGGDAAMHDLHIWSFVPNRYRREIDHMWSGIGHWVA